MFFALTLALVVALAWMSWQLVSQDRALAAQRMQQRREVAADLAAVALQKELSDLEGQLGALHAGRADAYAAGLPPDTTLLIAGADTLTSFGPARLLFYPDAVAPAPASASMFAEADRLEFHDQDYARAGALLRELARNPAWRAEALLRLGRNLAKGGRTDESLTTYDALAQLGSVPAQGLPAALAAHEARRLLLRKQGSADAAGEARAICEGLMTGAWKIGRSAFEFYAAESCGRKAMPAAVAISAAAESLWEQPEFAGANGRRAGWYEGRPALAIWRSSGAATVVLLAGAEGIESLLLKPLRQRLESAGARLALTDSEGHALFGRPSANASVRLAAATQLPWTLHVHSTAEAATVTDRTRGRLILTGSLTLLLLVLAGSYLIGRAAAREVAVARLQADFVASVSHEFRTPITALRQLSELLASGRVATDEDRNEYYRALSRESERMHRLVEGLLNFGRLESGALQYRFERLDAIDFVETVVAEFRRDVEARGYTVELVANGSRPAISADRAALGCAVSNLLDNAVKYSPANSTVWVEVGHEAGDAVAIRVRDRGIGIPAAEQKQIFEKFVRGSAAKSGTIRGAGVGLAMTRQIVEAHRGEIRLESCPGEGSTFTLLLPEAS